MLIMEDFYILVLNHQFTLSKTLSKELSNYNIRVNSISPGLVDTKMTKDFISKNILDLEIKNFIKRMADPKEISSVILFLASSKSSYINGANISVDSGL